MTRNLTSIGDVRKALEALGVRPNRGLGQNFLVERGILDVLVRAADLQPEDNILEIGAGLGVLTEELLATVSSVYAVELDKRLFQHLSKEHGEHPKLTLVQDDIVVRDSQVGGVQRCGCAGNRQAGGVDGGNQGATEGNADT